MTTDPGPAGDASASRPRPQRRTLAVCAGVLALALGGWVAYTVLRPAEVWMQPVTATEFAGPWSDAWLQATPGAFRKHGTGLVSVEGGPAVLIHRQRMQAPIAIEYEASIAADGTPGDLSVAWVERAEALADPPAFLAGGGARSIRLQVGAFDNTRSGIYEMPGNRVLAASPFRLEVGRRYRIRAELLADAVSLRVDGAEILRTELDLPLTSGHVALFGFYPGKVFHRAAVSSARVPASVSPLVAGDALFLARHFSDAAAQYARIAESHAGSDLADEARFRQGLAERLDGRPAQARRSWSQLKDPRRSLRASILGLDELMDAGSITEAATSFAELHARADAGLRHLLVQRWSAWTTAALGEEPPPAERLETLLWLRGKLFAADHLSGEPSGLALLALGRFAEVAEAYTAFERPRAQALLALGRGNEVVQAEWAAGYNRLYAAWQTGLINGVARDPYATAQTQALALCKLGEAEQALGLNHGHPALLHLGRIEEMLAVRPLKPAIASEALIVAGRFAEAAGAGSPAHPGSGSHPLALQLLGRYAEAEAVIGRPVPGLRLLQALEQGETAAIGLATEALIQAHTPLDHRKVNSGTWFSRCVLLPWAQHQGGTGQPAWTEAMREVARTFRWTAAQRPGLLAAIVAGDRPLEEIRSLPFTAEIEAMSALAEGLKADGAGDRAAAIAGYRRFAGLPLYRRLLHESLPNPEIERFVAWRLSALGER